LVLAGVNAVQSGLPTVGWKFLHEASDIALPMFKQHHPRTLDCLVSLASKLQNIGQLSVCRSIWSFIREMAYTTLGLMHPVSVTCNALLVIEDISQVEATVIELVLSVFEQSFGCYDRLVLEIKADYFSSLSKLRSLAEQERLARDFVRDCVYIKNDVLVVGALIRLGCIKDRQNDTNGALQVLRDAVRRGKSSGEHRFPIGVDIYAVINLASVIFRQVDYSEGESLLRECLERCPHGGHHDLLTVQVLRLLEIFLRKKGNRQEIDDLRFKYPHVFL
jgi:hypothetical protein